MVGCPNFPRFSCRASSGFQVAKKILTEQSPRMAMEVAAGERGDDRWENPPEFLGKSWDNHGKSRSWTGIHGNPLFLWFSMVILNTYWFLILKPWRVAEISRFLGRTAAKSPLGTGVIQGVPLGGGKGKHLRAPPCLPATRFYREGDSLPDICELSWMISLFRGV